MRPDSGVCITGYLPDVSSQGGVEEKLTKQLFCYSSVLTVDSVVGQALQNRL